MSSIRRAFFFSSAERYLVILINFAMVPIIARLMGPAEFGISVLGMAALAIAEVIRDFGGAAYIIQEKRLTLEGIRTAFTVTLVWTLVLAIGLFLVAEPLARFYDVPGLALYLRIIAFSYLIGPFVAEEARGGRQIERAGRAQSCVFAERVTGHEGGALHLHPPRAQGRDCICHNRGLGVGGQRQLVRRPLAHDPGEVEAQRIVHLLPHCARGGLRIHQRRAHADRLAALAGEEVGAHGGLRRAGNGQRLDERNGAWQWRSIDPSRPWPGG